MKIPVCPFILLFVIASHFWGLQFIPESCQTPHIINHWKEDDNENDKDTHKDKYKDENNDKDNVLKRPVICYIFQKFKDIKYDS